MCLLRFNFDLLLGMAGSSLATFYRLLYASLLLDRVRRFPALLKDFLYSHVGFSSLFRRLNGIDRLY
jgi:hypothetical protein